MIGHASEFNPICPGKTEGFVLIDFGLRITLFAIVPPVAEPVHSVKVACPFVKEPRAPPVLGKATP